MKRLSPAMICALVTASSLGAVSASRPTAEVPWPTTGKRKNPSVCRGITFAARNSHAPWPRGSKKRRRKKGK